MNKLIVFHPDENKFLAADRFEHYSFNRQEAYQKLDELSSLNPDSPIVFRINFENIENSGCQKILHHLPFIDIFILREYQELQKLNNQSEKTPRKFNLYYLNSLVSKNRAQEDIEKIKEKIQNGYFYQVNYSIPFQGKTDPELNVEDLFTSLRSNFLGDLHALLPLNNDRYLLSFSPELFLKKVGTHFFTEPIKGTAPKGSETSLLESEKENAELSMIVDLLRNDLNEISNAPVKVNFHRKILQLPYLSHTYSQIEGTSEKTIGAILKSMLPGGSISGCPKKESVKTIYLQEPFKREHYTGVIGVVHKNKMRASIVIRSLLYNKTSGVFTYNAGSGIVYDSITNHEIDEIYLKSKSLLESPTWNKCPPSHAVIFSTTPEEHVPLKESYGKEEILFSTLLLRSNEICDLDMHLDRLYHSLQTLSRKEYCPKEVLRKKILDLIPTITKNHLDHPPLRLRINLTSDSFFLEWENLSLYKDELLLGFCDQFTVKSNNLKLNHKLNQYDDYYAELRKHPELDDLIFINDKGNVTETTKANIFFVDNKNLRLWTPPIHDGLLPGIERQKLLNQKCLKIFDKEYLIEEKSLSMIEVQENFSKGYFTNILVTNSLMGRRYGKLKL